MRLQEVINEYILAMRARRLSPYTIKDYNTAFRKLMAFLGEDKPFEEITVHELNEFLARLTVSNKTALNHHTALSSLWRWANTQGLVPANIVRQIPPPRPSRKEIQPLTREEFAAMLHAAEFGEFPKRDKALLLAFLDTGARLSEIANARISDLNIQGHYLVVLGKGNKERKLPLSDTTLKAILAYLDARGLKPPFKHGRGASLFDLTDSGIRKTIYRLSAEAGIHRVNPHRLRHTFAILFLRNGGNIYALQKILGHTTLDMVKRYLALAQTDVDTAHAKASPVKRWLSSKP